MFIIALSVTSGSISIASLGTVIGVPVGVASASFSLAFSMSKSIVKKLLKTTRNKKKKHNKIVMLARGKLNSIEIKLAETLINSEFRESIRMMKTQRSDTEKSYMIKKGKRKGIDEIIRQNACKNNVILLFKV